MSTSTQSATDDNSYYVLGETLRPLVTNKMGSAIEIFDTRVLPVAARRRTTIRGKRRTS